MFVPSLTTPPSGRLERMGIVARASTPDEFVAAIEDQRVKLAAIAAAIGTKPTQ